MDLIVVDSSALIEIALSQPYAERCLVALRDSDRLIISPTTLAETLIVASRKGVTRGVERLLHELRFHVEPVTESTARAAAGAYDRWGKGVHSARLNLGDCFAYALAEEKGCPLLFVGYDFAQTDIPSVLP